MLFMIYHHSQGMFHPKLLRMLVGYEVMGKHTYYLSIIPYLCKNKEVLWVLPKEKIAEC